jgi:hypothetical protein
MSYSSTEYEPLVLNNPQPPERQIKPRRKPRAPTGRKRGGQLGSGKIDRRVVAAFPGTIADAALHFGCSPAMVSICRKESRNG